MKWIIDESGLIKDEICCVHYAVFSMHLLLRS